MTGPAVHFGPQDRNHDLGPDRSPLPVKEKGTAFQGADNGKRSAK